MIYSKYSSKGESFSSATKILLHFTLCIFKDVNWKNKQTKLTAEVLHTRYMTVKSFINPHIQGKVAALISTLMISHFSCVGEDVCFG